MLTFTSSSEISEADTIFCPHVQAGWANINWEQDMICQTVSQLTKSGSLYFCSGYFNPPLPLCAAIRDSQCSVNLLSADREANGFNKARWPKSGITPAYQMFADFMLKSIEDKEVKLSEWNRDKSRLIKIIYTTVDYTSLYYTVDFIFFHVVFFSHCFFDQIVHL